MEIKQIEIRDSATMIPALAIKVSGNDGWLMRRAGYGPTSCTLLIYLATGEAQYDPFAWRSGADTIPAAHHYLIDHWDDIPDGGLVDARVARGQTDTPCESEKYTSL
jgi:hypothetical protein